MKNSHSTALVYFAFARPWHTAESLASLASNHGSSEMPLYIFSDAARNPGEQARVAEVREVLRKVTGFRELHLTLRERNFGCAENIIDGVSQVLRHHDSVIVVEDDLQLSPYFVAFIKRGLDTYADRADIFSISGASPSPIQLGLSVEDVGDVYLAPRSVPTGWGTWRDRWESVDWEVDGYRRNRWRPSWRKIMARGGNDLATMMQEHFDGRIDAWDIRFIHAQLMSGAFSLYPRQSYVRNMGFDGSGTHSRATDRELVELDKALPHPVLPEDIQPDEKALAAVKKFHDEHPLSLVLGSIPGVRQLIRKLKRRLDLDKPLLKRRGWGGE